MNTAPYPEGIDIIAPVSDAHAEILSAEALIFLASLARRFSHRRNVLLEKRRKRQLQIDTNVRFDFLTETRDIRNREWKVSPIPKDLSERRVEIAGPPDRETVIHTLNSGANVYIADFEDSFSPMWENIMDGQVNLRDAANRLITHTNPTGKPYRLNPRTAVLTLRPRGWHLDEKHILMDGEPVPGALVDFGLYFFHNARNLCSRDTAPYFYLPKLESHEEAGFWGDIFAFAEQSQGLAKGTVKATVLIETIPAAFEMHEILYALRDYCVGLAYEPQDYLFSFIKTFRMKPDFILPDLTQISANMHFLRSCSQLLIQTCHRRGALAMGSMATHIPVTEDETTNSKLFAAMRTDKEREVKDGYDGSCVSHLAFVSATREIFGHHLQDKPNQLNILHKDTFISAQDLLTFPHGTITEKGLRDNIHTALYYIAAWLAGNGRVPIHNHMVDAAAAETSRAQLWQWVRHPKGALEDGRDINLPLFRTFLGDEFTEIAHFLGNAAFANTTFEEAAELLIKLVETDTFIEFLTLPGYSKLL